MAKKATIKEQNINNAVEKPKLLTKIKLFFANETFRRYVADKNNDKLENLIKAVDNLNNAISNDESLGDGFRIGHSYFCTKKEITLGRRLSSQSVTRARVISLHAWYLTSSIRPLFLRNV